MSSGTVATVVDPHPLPALVPIPGFSDPFSSLTHLLAAGAFLILGIVLLMRQRVGAGKAVSLVVFVFGVVFLLAMSGVFHLLHPGTVSRAVLQRLDHAAIFFLIASTFTPIHVIQFHGLMRWGFLVFIWSVAISGIVLKTIYFNEFPEWAGLSIYIGLGWLGGLSSYYLYRRSGLAGVTLILLGALAYTVGAVADFIHLPVIIPGVIGPHEFFHVMVLLGVSAHWLHVHRIATGRLPVAANQAHRARVPTPSA